MYTHRNYDINIDVMAPTGQETEKRLQQCLAMGPSIPVNPELLKRVAGFFGNTFNLYWTSTCNIPRWCLEKATHSLPHLPDSKLQGLQGLQRFKNHKSCEINGTTFEALVLWPLPL